jgi:hypothetical protein
MQRVLIRRSYANAVSVTVQTPGAASGPGFIFSEIEIDADSSHGALICGGGINQAIGTGMASNGNHVVGTERAQMGARNSPAQPGWSPLTWRIGWHSAEPAARPTRRSPRLPTQYVAPGI